MATPAAAAGAYASLARLTDSLGAAVKSGGAGAGAGSDFGALVKQAMNAIVETGHKADVQSVAAANGHANLVDVVTAVSQSEVAVDALVSVRDRMISAYEDILKMPI